MTKLRVALLALSIIFASGPLQAQDAAAPPPMLNEPTAAWNVYGPGQTHKARKDGAVQGGTAMRVTIPAKPANPWDIGASVPIKGAIAKGDRLILAFWVRLADGGKDGPADLGAAIQQNSAPYAPIVAGRVALSGRLETRPYQRHREQRLCRGQGQCRADAGRRCAHDRPWPGIRDEGRLRREAAPGQAGADSFMSTSPLTIRTAAADPHRIHLLAKDKDADEKRADRADPGPDRVGGAERQRLHRQREQCEAGDHRDKRDERRAEFGEALRLFHRKRPHDFEHTGNCEINPGHDSLLQKAAGPSRT
jgi:hypothetical protein